MCHDMIKIIKRTLSRISIPNIGGYLSGSVFCVFYFWSQKVKYLSDRSAILGLKLQRAMG